MMSSTSIFPAGIPVLITSAINVSASRTLLNDANTRIRLMLESIEHWRITPMVSHVIVCDGTGYDFSPHIKNMNLGPAMVDCEVISFFNDASKVKVKGKGYGEGEIVNYALQNSVTLGRADTFAKCTGKLWVENFSECLRNFNDLAVFDFFGKFKPDQIDTRFYIVKKEFYDLNISLLHNKVDDNNNFYLEHAFRDGLMIFKLSNYVMFPTPKIRGVSGSMGIHYRQSRIKYFLRDARSLIIKYLRMG